MNQQIQYQQKRSIFKTLQSNRQKKRKKTLQSGILSKEYSLSINQKDRYVQYTQKQKPQQSKIKQYRLPPIKILALKFKTISNRSIQNVVDNNLYQTNIHQNTKDIPQLKQRNNRLLKSSNRNIKTQNCVGNSLILSKLNNKSEIYLVVNIDKKRSVKQSPYCKSIYLTGQQFQNFLQNQNYQRRIGNAKASSDVSLQNHKQFYRKYHKTNNLDMRDKPKRKKLKNRHSQYLTIQYKEEI